MNKRFASRVLLLVLTLSLLTPIAAAQNTISGRMTGTVTDQQGALIGRAQIVAVNDETKAEFKTSANAEGGWSIPAVPNGTYTVTITQQGFKSTVVQNVKVDTGSTATVNAALEVGGASEQVFVTSGAAVIQTETATVQTTIEGRQISDLPYTTREALQLVLTMPGVQTPGTPRTSSINGLPKAALNMTLDGANIQDNFLKSSDGFFTSTQVRTDAIEEVTVSMATPGAESAAGGAAQVKFVTKAGSNTWKGALFWQHRNDAFNANYFFNNVDGLPRDIMRLNQFGGNIGGPITIPKLFNGKDKAFFFFNYEDFRLPQTYNVDRTVLTDTARQGIYTYRDANNAVRQINLLQLAARGAGGRTYTSTIDPRIGNALNLIAEAQTKGILVGRIGTNNDYNRLNLTFQDPGSNIRRFPTLRLDFNLTDKHHLEFVHNYQHYFSLPDGVNSIVSIYPGVGTHLGSPEITGGSIHRNNFTFAMAERWTINDRIVNEVRATSSGNGTSNFRREFAPGNYSLFNGMSVGNPFSTGFFTYTSTSRRNTPVRTLTDNVNWMKGTHNLNLGVSYTRINSFTLSASNQVVPTIALGIVANDPINTGATGIFTTANFPGSTAAQRSEAQQLYSLLTGRISSTSASVTLNEDTGEFSFTPYIERNHQTDLGIYAQDSWKIRPNLTINYGLRWEIQSSPVNDNGIYTRVGPEGVWGVSGIGNFFKPGVYQGKLTEFRLVDKGEEAFDKSLNDFAPTFGFAWQPDLGKGFLRRIFGDAGQTVLRGGASIAFVREGFNAYTSMFGSNEGPSVALGTSAALDPTIFGPHGSRLLRDIASPAQLPLRPIPAPKFPLTSRLGASINDFEPDLKPGYVSSWTFGWQRELTKDTAVEFRYVGNHGTHLWRQYEIGEVNIFENGFLDEFKIAMENLRIARLTSPTSNNFGNQNLPGQRDIPIIRTALNTTNDTGFATTILRGEAGRLAANIAQDFTRMNRLIAAGLIPSVTIADPNNPGVNFTLSNFFVANPQSPTNSWIMTNAGDSTYNAFQAELRRRLSNGLLVQGSYVWSKSLTNAFGTSSAAATGTPTTLRNLGFDKGPAPRDSRHGIKFDWLYELPVGPGRRFLNGNMPVVRKLLEGWQWSGVMRLQSGTPSLLSSGRLTFNNRDAGVVLNNITLEQLQKLVKIRKDTDPVTGKGVVYYLPKEFIANTLAAFELGGTLNPALPYIGPPTKPGEMGQRIYLYGPWTSRWDLNIMKRTYITETVNIEFRTQFLNAFNQSGLTIRGAGTDSSGLAVNATSFGQTRNAYRDFSVSGTNDPGGRLIEFQFRLNF